MEGQMFLRWAAHFVLIEYMGLQLVCYQIEMLFTLIAQLEMKLRCEAERLTLLWSLAFWKSLETNLLLAVSESLEVTSPAEDAVELETLVKEESPLPAEPG